VRFCKVACLSRRLRSALLFPRLEQFVGLEPIRWHSVALVVAVHSIHQHMQRGREGEREGGGERESERGRGGFVAGHDIYI
jgi:hypothetical protein